MRSLALNKKCISFFVMILILIAGCRNTPPENPANSVSNQEPLFFRITWKAYSGRGEAIQKIVRLYNNSNEGKFNIVMTDGDEDIKAIADQLITGTKVDIYVLPYRYVKFFGDNGKLLNLNGCFEADKPYFYKNLWDLGMVGEKTYGIPWLGHSIALIYNQDLLRKAGVDPHSIKSIQELVTACEQVESKTKAKGIALVGANHNDVSWMVNQFIYSFGSNLMDKDQSKVVINNEKARAAIEFYKNDLGAHAQKDWSEDTGIEAMNCFRNQEVAFELQGPWGVADIWKNGDPFEVGVIALESIGLKAEIGPLMLALPANISEDKKASAINFIRFMISKTAQEKIMDGEYSPEHDAYYPFRVPARSDMANSDFFKNHPEFIPFLDGYKNPSIDVPAPQWQTIKDQYYAPGLHQVMENAMSTDMFLKTIETEGNRILTIKE